MTTETKQVTRDSGTAVLLGAAAAASVLGLGVAVAGGLTGGSEAALGALTGTFLVVGVLAFGSLVVNAVAGWMPPAALLFAVLTYTLQVVLMGLVFVGLSRSGVLDGTIDRGWLGGTVIAGTMGWVACQVVLSTRRRIPAFDLAPERPARPVRSSPRRVGP